MTEKAPLKSNKFLFFIVIFICIFIYWPGLSGGFLFDDIPNIVQNDKLIAVSDFSFDSVYTLINQHESGPIGRPVSFISFAVNHALTGLNPFFFKLTNLLIHLLCGTVLFFLLKTLLVCHFYKIPSPPLNINLLALTVSSAWLLHPFQITTVLYIVQRMAQLSTLFTLLALLFYALARLKLIKGEQGAKFYLMAIPIPFILALFSKENGILLLGYLFVTEVFLLQFKANNQGHSQWLKKAYLVFTVIGLPLFVLVMYKLSHNAYVHRDFTLTERILTESRVLWFYIQSILIPNISSMTIFHDDFMLSTSLFKPLSTLFSIIGIILLIFSGIWLRNKAPIITFGLFLFFAAHLLESTTIPLELIHEHRNYFASIGLLMAFFYSIFRIMNKLPYQTYFSFFIVLFIMFFAINTYVRASYWGDNIKLADYHAYYHPKSVRSMLDAGSIYTTYGDIYQSDAHKLKALEYYKKAYHMKPSEVAALTSILSIQSSLNIEDKNKNYHNKLLYNLEHTQVTAETMGAFVSASRCIDHENCDFPINLYRNMAIAILKNPTLLNKKELAQIYSIHSNLAWLDKKIDLAISYNQKAVEAFPQEPQYALNQVAMLIAKKQLLEAEKYLKLAEKYENGSTTNQRISAFREQIKQINQ